MSDKKKFTVFKGLTREEMLASTDVVRDSIEAASKENTIGGKLLKHGLQMTGSEGEMIKSAMEAYSRAYNPVIQSLLEVMNDDKKRAEVHKKIAALMGSNRSGRKGDK